MKTPALSVCKALDVPNSGRGTKRRDRLGKVKEGVDGGPRNNPISSTTDGPWRRDWAYIPLPWEEAAMVW